MYSFPNEVDFISLFCVEPTKLDNNIPFYYNESSFRFENQTESFFVSISPSYGDFILEVKSKDNEELIVYNSFKAVKKLEILSDTRDAAKILLILERDPYITTVEITFKPKFSFIIKEQYTE